MKQKQYCKNSAKTFKMVFIKIYGTYTHNIKQLCIIKNYYKANTCNYHLYQGMKLDESPRTHHMPHFSRGKTEAYL